MADYVSAYTGAQIDAALGTVAGSNLATTFKITRPATIVLAANDSTAVAKLQADYVCDGTADDVEINAALTAAVSGDTILFLEGSYVVTAELAQVGKSLNLKAQGNVVFTVTTATDGACCFKFSGAATITTTITAAAAQGAAYITLASVADLAAGDLLIISHTTEVWSASYTGSRTGEMYKIKSISGNDVYLEDYLLRAYAEATTAIRTYRPITINIENLIINGPGSGITDRTGIKLYYCTNSNIDKCVIRDNGTSSISLETCYSVNVTGCKIKNSLRDGYGYGVMVVNSTAKVLITGNEIAGCTHCITSGFSTTPGANRDIIIDKNILKGETPIDAHPITINYIITNNIIQAESVAIADGTQHSIVANNQIFIPLVTGGMCNERSYITLPRTRVIVNNIIDHGYIYMGNEVSAFDSIFISGNFLMSSAALGANTHGVFIAPGASAVKNIQVMNNNINATGQYGIYVSVATATCACTLNIVGNNTRDTGRNGICIDGNVTYDNLVNIANNTIMNSNYTDSGTYSGIKISNCLYATIALNKINNILAGNDTKGLETGSGCNYTLVFGNTLRGMGGAKITLAGANDINEHNQEYA